MNRTLLAPLVTGLLLLGLALPAAAGLPDLGQAAPDFTLKTLDGEQEYTLSELDGKVVYIDFWASWCGPCRRSFPEVEKLYGEFKDQGFLVLAVSIDQKHAAAVKFFDKQGSEFPGLYDEGGKVAMRYGVRNIPTAILVASDGKVAHSAIGFDPRKLPELRSKIEGLLEDASRTEREAGRLEAEGAKS